MIRAPTDARLRPFPHEIVAEQRGERLAPPMELDQSAPECGITYRSGDRRFTVSACLAVDASVVLHELSSSTLPISLPL